MSDELNFDARKFAMSCLTGATGAIDDLYDSSHMMKLGDTSVDSFDARSSELGTTESTIVEMGHGFVAQEIYTGLFEDVDEDMNAIISKLNALLDRYDPTAQRWQAADYDDYDDFWTNFNEDFGFTHDLAAKIVELDAPDFFDDLSLKLSAIADNSVED